ncbi:hypothetical protein [Helicobacter sp. T3_23-1056]
MAKITNPSLKTFCHCKWICQNPRGDPPSHRHCEILRSKISQSIILSY